MRAWNTETRDEAGRYYRIGDWSVDASRVAGKENFTTISPPPEAFAGCACDWVGGQWVVDATSLADTKKAERASRYKSEADPLLLAALGYMIEKEAGAAVDEKLAKAKADYLAAKAKIRQEVQ